MSRNITMYIKDIIDNMENAKRFTEKITYEEFVKDDKTSYAVIRCIEIIGEAAKNIPEEACNKYPEIPWKEMAGMRDKVIHFYFGVNLEKVWLVIKKDIPELEPLFKKVLEKLKNNKF